MPLLCPFHVATAGLNGSHLGDDERDIVEIAFVIADPAAEQQTAERTLVRPADSLELTDAAKEETGLRDEQLTGAPDLGRALQQVESSLFRRGVPVLLVCDGPLPLRQVLHPQACKKGIPLSELFSQYVDVRKEFQRTYGGALPQSLREMAQALGLDEPNSRESTLRHVVLMAHILRRLAEAGHVQMTPEPIMRRLEQGLCLLDEHVSDDQVVRARGLPWQSSDHDVARFFAGINIHRGGVALCLSAAGRRNGEALVRFESREHRELALRRHRHHIGQRYIEVYKATGADFIQVAGGNNADAHKFLSRSGQVIVRMRGLPFEANAKDVVNFFLEAQCHVVDGEDGVLFVRHADGRATGDSFVMFCGEDEASRALGKHKDNMGARYIELFRSTAAEVQQVLRRSQEPKPSDQGPLIPWPPLPAIPNPGQRKDCLRLRGLPLESGVEHILEFLGPHSRHIVAQGVHMVYSAQGMPSGEAFIQMDSEPSSYNAALQKHVKTLMFGGKRFPVEAYQVSSDDMNLVLVSVPVDAAATALQTGGVSAPLFSLPASLELSRSAPLVAAPSVYPQLLYWYPSPPVSPPSAYYVNLGAAGSTVLVRNVQPQEVAQLFPEVAAENVQLTRSADGQTDALVTFNSRVEAERVVLDKSRQVLGNRVVEMFLTS